MACVAREIRRSGAVTIDASAAASTSERANASAKTIAARLLPTRMPAR